MPGRRDVQLPWGCIARGCASGKSFVLAVETFAVLSQGTSDSAPGPGTTGYAETKQGDIYRTGYSIASAPP